MNEKEIEQLKVKIKLLPKDFKNKQYKFLMSLVDFHDSVGFLSQRQQLFLRKITKEYIKNLGSNGEYFINAIYDDKNIIITGVPEETRTVLEIIEYRDGVYFLYDMNGVIVYIGKSNNLQSRICTSMKNKNAVSFSFMLTRSHMGACILELYFIGIYKPVYNKDPITIDEINIEIKHNYEMSNIYALEYKYIGENFNE